MRFAVLVIGCGQLPSAPRISLSPPMTAAMPPTDSIAASRLAQ
ncbi:hypothetical protein [Burkholderia sp. F1]